ncbi:MAG: phospholipase D-like domain-containing protein [Dehalococcoidia bacterium]|jgi:phosphatidylserine/phosphatidylglycerophosphate/cardiolipin synthase-like enzyme
MNVRCAALLLAFAGLLVLSACQPSLSSAIQSPPTVQAGEPEIQAFFPRAGQDPAPVLVKLYSGASTSLDIAIYSLTHPDIVKAIGDARQRGVQVRVITDNEQAAGNTQKHAVDDLLTLGIPVKVNLHSGLMHLKMSVIDGKIATIGSYNYTQSASQQNDEVMAVVTQPAFVKSCQDEFNRLWDSPGLTDAKESY